LPGLVKNFESLSTSYVNLAALIRHLRGQNFVGSIQVLVGEYEAEVKLQGLEAPTVLEIDPETRNASKTDGSMERLLVHAREPGGIITVFTSERALEPADPIEDGANAVLIADELSPPHFETTPLPPAAEVDWIDLLDAGGKLVGAVEHAVQGSGADFESSFRASRIELGDDYPFLDPTGNELNYSDKRIVLSRQPPSHMFVAALSECLRRLVDKLAVGKESKRFRETVAIELAVAARVRSGGLGEFTKQLDRIAGTRVL
jgi:hypothetical protein